MLAKAAAHRITLARSKRAMRSEATASVSAAGRAATETQRGPPAKIERLFRQALAAITGRSAEAAHPARRKRQEKDDERGMVWKAAKTYMRILTAPRGAGRPDIARSNPQPRFNP